MAKDKGISPAALRALLEGDIENFLVASTPGGIEDQEKRGRDSLVSGKLLPIKFNYGKREDLEKFGVIFGEQVDDLFVNATLPDGWILKPTDHSMWSYLIDDKGRKRASIFYKAAFYDRGAFIDIERRFHSGTYPILGYEHPDYRGGGWVGVVEDCEREIWRTDEIGPEPSYPKGDEGRTEYLTWCDERNALEELASKWLDEHYPDWKNPIAYWE